MVARTVEPVAAAVGGRRCSCGHFPTTHMRVAPVSIAASGSFFLEPTGPCQVCGEAGCRRYSPTGAVP